METFIPLESDSTDDFRKVPKKIVRQTQLKQASETALRRQAYRQSDSCMDFVELLVMTSCVIFFGTGVVATTFPTYRFHYFVSFGGIIGHKSSIVAICTLYFISGVLEISCAVLLFFCINYYSNEHSRKFVLATISVCTVAAFFLFVTITLTIVSNPHTKEEITENLYANFPPKDSKRSHWDLLQTKLKCCGVHNATEWNTTRSTNSSPPISCCLKNMVNNTCTYAKHGCADSLYKYYTESIRFYHGLSWVLTITFLVYLVFQKRHFTSPEIKREEVEPEDLSDIAKEEPTYSSVLQSLTKFLNDLGVTSQPKKPRKSFQIIKNNK